LSDFIGDFKYEFQTVLENLIVSPFRERGAALESPRVVSKIRHKGTLFIFKMPVTDLIVNDSSMHTFLPVKQPFSPPKPRPLLTIICR